MIYKFIDNNGSEITVNSLSSLQGLIESEVVKENTKIKAGLRGKWTTAGNIEELKEFFITQEEEVAPEAQEEQEDIKSFLTKEVSENEIKSTESIPDPQPEKKEVLNEPPKVEKKHKKEKEIIAKKTDSDLKSDEELEEEEKNRDKTYDDDNVIGLNFFEAIGICFKKYFNFRDRASRSEYWYFQLLITPVYIISYIPTLSEETWIFIGLFFLVTIIPAFSVAVRRFHDIDKSGWYILISLIPLVGWIIMLVMLAGKGTEGKNRFGKYPLKLIT